MATETPARGSREECWRACFLLDRAVPLEVRACEGTSEGSSTEVFMLGHALCRSSSSSENSALAATPQIGGILHSTCRAPVLLVGVELVRSEGRMSNLVQYSGHSNSGLLRGCGVDVDKS